MTDLKKRRILNQISQGKHVHPDIKELIDHYWPKDGDPSAFELFRVYDEITLIRSDELVASSEFIEYLTGRLGGAMVKENITHQELSNRALWRDQDW